MLRDRKPISTFTFSTPKRIALWSTLAALGLVIAGLRGPGAATAQAAPGDGELGVQGAADAKPIDLTYVSGDAAMVVAVRPGDVMKTAAAKLVWQAVPDSEPMKIERTLGLPIADIEYVKFIMGDFPSNGHNPFSRIVLRAAKPHDWSKFAATIVSDPVPVDLLGGKKYFKPAKPVDAGPGGFNPPPFCYFAPDDRTVIFATETGNADFVRRLGQSWTRSQMGQTWQRASTGGLAVMLNVENLRRHIEPLKPASGGPDAAIMAMMAPTLAGCEPPLRRHRHR